jgi:hypothetical protein
MLLAAFDPEELGADGLFQVRNDAVGGRTVLIVCRTTRPVPGSYPGRAHSTLKEEAQPLPERLDWRCAPQRGYLIAAMLIYPLTGDRRVVSSAGSVY